MDNRQHLVRETLPRMFDSVVARYGDCRCQWWQTGPETTASLNYTEVGQVVRELTSGLMCLNVVKQDRVAIMARNCPQWLWADFSILNAGAVTVAIYPRLSQREMAYIINDSGTRILYVDDTVNLIKVLNMRNELPRLEKVIVMQNNFAGSHPDILNLSQVRELGARFLLRHPEAYDERWQSVGLHDRATMVYSSGISGRRRGVVHTHNSINAGLLRDLRISPPLSVKDIFLSVISLSYLYERLLSQMLALSVGATIAYSEKLSSIIKDIQVFHPTVFCTVPGVLEQVFMTVRENYSKTPEDQRAFDAAVNTAQELTEFWEDEDGCIDIPGDNMGKTLSPDLRNKLMASENIFRQFKAMMGSKHRFSFSGARPLSPELYRMFLASGVMIYDGYGINETAGTVTAFLANPSKKILPGSIGCLVTEDEAKVLPNGEFAVRGQTLFKEYWNDPEFTEEAFTPNRFFKTGDLVEMLPNGYLQFVGRTRDMLFLENGERVIMTKVENLFSLSNYISQICVYGHGQKYITALIVPNFDAFIKLFEEEGLQYNEADMQFMNIGGVRTCIKAGSGFIGHKRLMDVIDTEIQQANRQLPEHESIQRYTIINRRFTAEADEMTPRMNLKRDTIYKNFALDIHQLYS
ncbi:MAG: AMP-binding protein [Syntrophomonadaceae bacterium]|nr:AMP-binding protein [Syntrophomonadaceae bacterium]